MVRKDKKRKKLVLASILMTFIMLGSTLIQINASKAQAQNWWEDIWDPLEPTTGDPETGQPDPTPIPQDKTKPTTTTTLSGGHTESYKDYSSGDQQCHTASYKLYKSEEDITIRVVAQEPGLWYVESGIDYVTVTIDHNVGLGASGVGGRFNGENTFLVPYKYGNIYELTVEFLGEKGNHYMEVVAYDKAGHKSVVEKVWVRMVRIPNEDECVPQEEVVGTPTQAELTLNDCSSTTVGYFTVAGKERYKDEEGFYYCKTTETEEFIYLWGPQSYAPGWYKIEVGTQNERSHHAWTPKEAQAYKEQRYEDYGIMDSEITYMNRWSWISTTDPGQ